MRVVVSRLDSGSLSGILAHVTVVDKTTYRVFRRKNLLHRSRKRSRNPGGCSLAQRSLEHGLLDANVDNVHVGHFGYSQDTAPEVGVKKKTNTVQYCSW